MKKKEPNKKAADGNEKPAAETREDSIKGKDADAEKDAAAVQDAPDEKGKAEPDAIRDLENRLEETNDRFLRLFSEFDNYRKRTAREKLELVKTASEDMITALLPVVDDLERACSMDAPGDNNQTAGSGNDPVIEGFSLILNKLKAILRQKGVEEIAACGQEFDTDLHEAITHIPAASEDQKGRIVDEIQKGYKLNGKVIRYSRVVVAS